MVGSAGIEPAAFTQEWRIAILYGFLQVTAPELRHSPKGQANKCFLEPVVMPGLTTTPTFLVVLTPAYLYIIERAIHIWNNPIFLEISCDFFRFAFLLYQKRKLVD